MLHVDIIYLEEACHLSVYGFCAIWNKNIIVNSVEVIFNGCHSEFKVIAKVLSLLEWYKCVHS